MCIVKIRKQRRTTTRHVWTVVLSVLLGIAVCFLIIMVGCFMTRERKQRDEEKRRREEHERRQQAIALNTTAADDAPVSFKMCRRRPSLDAHDFRRRAASDSRRPLFRPARPRRAARGRRLDRHSCESHARSCLPNFRVSTFI